jgi:hypothetical protein
MRKGGLMKTLLLNYVFHSPVGHTVEALRYSRGLAAANPDVEAMPRS